MSTEHPVQQRTVPELARRIPWRSVASVGPFLAVFIALSVGSPAFLSPLNGGNGLDAISLVCKVIEANGRPAVKLSDNPEKATGDPAEIARYLRIFGDAGRKAAEVRV